MDLSCALPLDNLDMTVPIGIPRVSTISLYERLFQVKKLQRHPVP
jgi:hypothetical protein